MNFSKFLADHWGDLASVIGLVLAIWASLGAKKAAEQARDRIATLDTLADVSAAIAIMEEIKRLHRVGAWQIALDRYSTLRRHLVRVEQMNPGLTDTQRKQVARAIAQFRIIETKVEGALLNPDAVNTVPINREVSVQIDSIEKILTAIKQAGV